MAASVSVTGGKAWKGALTPYRDASNIYVAVGIFEKAKYSGEVGSTWLPVAFVAAKHEFGAENIPCRSFMRSTRERRGNDWVRAVAAYLRSHNCKFRAALTIAGELMSKDMQAAIEAGIPPASSPKTIEAKQRRGKDNPNTPLVDTGTMQESINFEVRT